MDNSREKLIAIGKLACLITPGKRLSLSSFISKYLPDVLTPVEAYEIILQSYLFFGYPQAIESSRLFTEELRKTGIRLEHANNNTNDIQVFRERGEKLCRQIYNPNFEKLISNMKEISPELSEWMITEGYGKVLSRKQLQPLEREIASIIFLTCSRHPVQLFSHLRGARNLGGDLDLLSDVITQSGMEDTEYQFAMEIIRKVF